MSQTQPANPTEFTPITVPNGCEGCFFAQGIVGVTNLAAIELRSGGATTATRYKQLRATYAGGCALRDSMEQDCEGSRVLYAEGERVMTLCGHLRRLLKAKETADDEPDRPERSLKPDL